MVDFFISAAQVLSLIALLYGAYFLIVRDPHMTRAPRENARAPVFNAAPARNRERTRG